MENKEVQEGISFLRKLFDFSFTRFITLDIAKLLFGIAIVGCALATIGLIAASFASGTLAGIVVLLVSPIIFLVMVIWARVSLELMIVIFRIAEDVNRMGSAPKN